MIFCSKIFIFLFLPLVYLFYYGGISKIRIQNIKYQNVILLIASLLFYAYGEIKYVFLLMLVILINWILVLFMEKAEKKRIGFISKTFIFVFTIIMNVLILIYFKYFNLITETLFNIHIIEKKDITNIVLPIGISFYMFQVISYVADVYMGKVEACRNIIEVGLYVAFFPQLIAGPIVRYNDISEQIRNREYSYEKIAEGFFRFSFGLAKKVLIADYLNFASTAVLGTDKIENLSVLLCWFGAVCYTLQIYFDFSGYSDMAIGLSAMFGFRIQENFNYPYISKNITEFWRRWHMSLSGWMKDYIYIPLGGSRCSLFRNIFNLFIVWLVTGIWHGANWTFLLWGIWYFIFILLERYIIKIDFKETDKRITVSGCIYRVITLMVIIIGWVIFYENAMESIFRIVGGMFGLINIPVIDNNFIQLIKFYSVIFPFAIIFCFPIYKIVINCCKTDERDKINSLVAVFLFFVSLIVVYAHTNSPFIYFQF